MERDKSSQNPTFSIKPFERRPLTYHTKPSQVNPEEQQPAASTETVPPYAAARVVPQIGDHGETIWELPQPITQTTVTEVNMKAEIVERFDKQIARLEALKNKLQLSNTSPQDRVFTPAKIAGNHSGFSTYLLPGTLKLLDNIAHPPLLPARLADIFERDFRRVEAMFHTVFYRKYHPEVLADAKQQAFLGLYKKWLKNRHLLSQSASYIVTAAIYSVSNWRQKSQDVRANEGTLLIDSHGKIMGHTAVHGTERWTDRIDFEVDLASAVECVLYQYSQAGDYHETRGVMRDIVDNVPFQEGQKGLNMKRGTYMKKRNAIKEALREHLREYRDVQPQ